MDNKVTVSYRLGKYGLVPVVFLIVSLLYSLLDHVVLIRYGYLYIVILFIPLFMQCFRYIRIKYTLIINQDNLEISGEKIIKVYNIKKIELMYETSLFIYVDTKNLLGKIVSLQVDQADKERLNELLLAWSKQHNKNYQRKI